MVKRVKQLDRTVESLLKGDFSDIPAMDVKRIFPLIASVEPMRWTPMLHAYLLREVPGLLQQLGVQPLQFLELENLEALMSVLGPSSLARVLDRKIKEAGVDADVQQWFFYSPVAPQPTRPAIVTERMDRLFSAMVIHLGFENDAFEPWKAEREGPTY